MYNKEAIYKYKESHKEKWDEQMRKNAKAYYQRNKEDIRRKNLERYHRKREQESPVKTSFTIFY